ncbi:rRNA maturation RNase YbeY [Candidatus Daviesbacteria bacterium]|nr:rRNA maturation RNase YbeY [Candidatus Daviesbacteria bacterium]
MINIIVNCDPRYPVNKLAIQATVVEILNQQRISGNVEIGINIVGDRKMHEFNKKYRGIDATTNILSFALEDPASSNQLQHIPRIGFVKAPDKVLRLGDILISYPQVIKDASQSGSSVEEEVRFLVEHGMKHLLGVHHD